MPLGTEVGLGPGHIVLGGEPVPPPQKGDISSQCSAHVCYGEMAGLIKIPLGMEEGLGPGHIVLDGDTVGTQPPQQPTLNFWLMSVVAKWLDGSRCHLVQR